MSNFSKFYYLFESTEYPNSNNEDYTKWLEKAIVKLLHILDKPVIWKGYVSEKGSHPIIKIINDRSDFRGGHEKITNDILKGIGIKKPTFATFDLTRTRVFGETMIFIPISTEYKLFQSKKVDDMGGLSSKEVNDEIIDIKLNKKKIQDIIDSYQEFNTIKKIANTEVIIDIDEYYLVRPHQILFVLAKSEGKFQKIKSIEEIKKYNDVLILLKDYIEFLKYLEQKRK